MGGSGETSIGSKTKLFEKVFSQEFRILNLFLKNPGFYYFLNPSFPPESTLRITPAKLFLKMAGCLRTNRFLLFFFGF